jgi:hypothetical protein
MKAGIQLSTILLLVCAGCFSPSYHNGNLTCTTSRQCPKDYHCATNLTCWHNGTDPDASMTSLDAEAPDARAASEAGVVPKDDASGPVDHPQMPDLERGVDGATIDGTSDADAATDLPLVQDAGGRDVVGFEVIDAPLTDAALPMDGADAIVIDAGGVQLDQLAAEYARVVCNRNFACCTPTDTKGKTPANCQQNVANLFKNAVDAIRDGVDRGRTIYFPERAQECLQTLEATSCAAWPLDPVTELPAICASSIAPQIGNGGPCRTVADCISGLCIGATSSADGTCMRKVASGETCELPPLGQNTCEPELYCDSSSKKCSDTKADGTSCGGNLECKSQTCGPAPDAGNICLPALCYSNGPLLPPACSIGGRPSAFAGGLVLAALAMLIRRRRPRSRG